MYRQAGRVKLVVWAVTQFAGEFSCLPWITGGGVIWDGIPFETPVIPANAGIQSVDSAFPKVCEVDSRFRGNDCGFERPCLANDTSTESRFSLRLIRLRRYTCRRKQASGAMCRVPGAERSEPGVGNRE